MQDCKKKRAPVRNQQKKSSLQAEARLGKVWDGDLFPIYDLIKKLLPLSEIAKSEILNKNYGSYCRYRFTKK